MIACKGQKNGRLAANSTMDFQSCLSQCCQTPEANLPDVIPAIKANAYESAQDCCKACIISQHHYLGIVIPSYLLLRTCASPKVDWGCNAVGQCMLLQIATGACGSLCRSAIHHAESEGNVGCCTCKTNSPRSSWCIRISYVTCKSCSLQCLPVCNVMPFQRCAERICEKKVTHMIGTPCASSSADWLSCKMNWA